jgi:hypothetical protein
VKRLQAASRAALPCLRNVKRQGNARREAKCAVTAGVRPWAGHNTDSACALCQLSR